jgi:hypothetical protein
MQAERFTEDSRPAEGDELLMGNAAVLQPTATAIVKDASHAVINTLLQLITPSELDSKNVIPVVRSADPVVEWTENGEMIACTFPQLFMLGGSHLPNGSWGQDFVSHLMKYYGGRFEKDIRFRRYAI